MNEQRANEELNIELEYERVKEQRYKAFQEWLNECPVKITRYEDFTDFFEVTFDVVDDEVEELEQCVIDTNGDYAECVDRMVESMEVSQ